MKSKRHWIRSITLCLASLGVLASSIVAASAATPPSESDHADANSVYYVGTRSFVTRIGWTVAKLPLALAIQVDPESSLIRESLTGGMPAQVPDKDGGGHGGGKVFTPVQGSSNLFHIQFDDTEGSGTLQTSSRAILSVAMTAHEFLEGLQWKWNFEVGSERTHVEGVGQFEPGLLHIKGTIRNSAGRYLINYRDEYKEVSFKEYSKAKHAIVSSEAK